MFIRIYIFENVPFIDPTVAETIDFYHINMSSILKSFIKPFCIFLHMNKNTNAARRTSLKHENEKQSKRSLGKLFF